MAHGTVWSFSPAMISIGPRSGFLVSTLSCDQGFRLAAAAWNSGLAGPGTEYVAYNSLASSSSTALAKP